MKLLYTDLKERKSVWIWGMGALLKYYANCVSPKLDIVGVVDKDISKHGKSVEIGGKILYCQDIKAINEGDAVVIAVSNSTAVKGIIDYLEKSNIAWCSIVDIVDGYYRERETDFKLEEYISGKNCEEKIVKFFDCTVPIDSCNLRCSYCFVGQKTSFENKKTVYHSPDYIRAALSQKRLGGIAYINFCGNGETMLCEELIPIVKALIEEGHYVQIVTNATITKAINTMLEQEMDFSHLFMKCSCQYLEMRKRNLLDIYAENVNRMRDKGVSVSVEITPHDELISYIDEIKEWAMDKFKALPHISTAWDSVNGFRLLSVHSKEEYKKIWGTFNSPMFNFKIENFEKKMEGHFCHAGEWSYNLQIDTGDLYQCVCHKEVDNIYNDIARPLKEEPVGKACCLPYCYNNHGYLTWGDISTICTPTYLDMRDRVDSDGRHWVTKEMGKIMSQRLYDNNKEH